MPAQSGAIRAADMQDSQTPTFFRQPGLVQAKRVVSEPAIAVLDKHGVVTFSSAAAGALFQASPDQLEGLEMARLLPGLPLKRDTPGFNLAFADFWGRDGIWLDFMGALPNGQPIPLAVSLRKLRVENSYSILLGFHAADERSSEEELTCLLRSVENKSDAVMVTDTSGIIHFVNAAFEQATGYTQAEVLGQPASIMKSGLHDPMFYKKMWNSLGAGQDFHAVFANRKKNGEIFHEYKYIRPFIDGAGAVTHFVAVSHGLSQALHTVLRSLQYHAYHDALTALPNRHLFLDRLRQALARSARGGANFALIYVDLDGFKQINDNHGHAVGDTVLEAAAKHLQASIRDEDTVARLGGDEFAIILLDVVHREDVEAVLRKLLLALAGGIPFEDGQIPICASLGAALYPEHGSDKETLMHHADAAMYRAKVQGCHGFCFYD